MLHVFADTAKKTPIGAPERLGENWRTIFGIKQFTPGQLGNLGATTQDAGYANTGLLTLQEMVAHGFKADAVWLKNSAEVMCDMVDAAVASTLQKGITLQLGGSYGVVSVKISDPTAILPILGLGFLGLAKMQMGDDRAPGDMVLRGTDNREIMISEPGTAVTAALQTMAGVTAVYSTSWALKRDLRNSATSLEALAIAADALETYYMAAFKR